MRPSLPLEPVEPILPSFPAPHTQVEDEPNVDHTHMHIESKSNEHMAYPCIEHSHLHDLEHIELPLISPPLCYPIDDDDFDDEPTSNELVETYNEALTSVDSCGENSSLLEFIDDTSLGVRNSCIEDNSHSKKILKEEIDRFGNEFEEFLQNFDESSIATSPTTDTKKFDKELERFLKKQNLSTSVDLECLVEKTPPEEMKELERLKLDCPLSYRKEEISVSLPISCVLPSSIAGSTSISHSIISLVPSCIEHMYCDHEHPFLTLYALDMSSIHGEDVFMVFDLEKEALGWLIKEKEGQDDAHFSILCTTFEHSFSKNSGWHFEKSSLDHALYYLPWHVSFLFYLWAVLIIRLFEPRNFKHVLL